MPQGLLRGEVPAGALVQGSRPVYSRLGFRVFLLTEYPYDPLIRRPTPSLDSRRPPDWFSRPDIAIDLHTHRPRLAWACLHCLSLISAWSDVAPPLATCCLLAALPPEPQISQPSADPCLSCRLALSCSPVLRIVRSCAWCDVCAPRPRATASQPPVPPAQHSSLPHRPAPAHSPPRQTTLSPNIFPHHLPPSPLTSHSPPHIPTSHTISA